MTEVSDRVLHLTFDDGPHRIWTPQVLDVLEAHAARAVFFPVAVLHDGGGDRSATVAGLDGALTVLGAQGWRFERLPGADRAG